MNMLGEVHVVRPQPFPTGPHVAQRNATRKPCVVVRHIVALLRFPWTLSKPPSRGPWLHGTQANCRIKKSMNDELRFTLYRGDKSLYAFRCQSTEDRNRWISVLEQTKIHYGGDHPSGAELNVDSLIATVSCLRSQDWCHSRLCTLWW